MIKDIFSLRLLTLMSLISVFVISCGSYNHNVYESDGVYYDPTAQTNEGYFEYEVDADNSNDSQYLSNIQLNNGATQWGVNEGTEVNYINNNYYGNNWGFNSFYGGYNPYWAMRPYMMYNPYWGWGTFRPGFSFNIGWNTGMYNNFWMGNPWGMGYYPPMYGYYGNPYNNGFYNGYFPGRYGHYYDNYGRRSTSLTAVNNNTMGRRAAQNVGTTNSSRTKNIVSTVPSKATINNDNRVSSRDRSTQPTSVRTDTNSRVRVTTPSRMNTSRDTSVTNPSRSTNTRVTPTSNRVNRNTRVAPSSNRTRISPSTSSSSRSSSSTRVRSNSSRNYSSPSSSSSSNSRISSGSSRSRR